MSKQMFFLIILMLLLGCSQISLPILADPHGSGKPLGENIINQQNPQIEVSLNSSSLTIYRNETGYIRVNVTVDGNLEAGAYFTLSDINYDLGETVLDLDNGTYIIAFIPASNEDIDTGNYSISLNTIYQGESVSTPFQFNLLSFDSINPILSVFSPKSNEIYVDYMFINITASDNESWKEFVVTFRGTEIFTLLQIENEFGRGTWNETHLEFTSYIYFEPVQGNNEIILSVVDLSNNKASVTINSTGDSQPPEINILTPLQSSIQLSKIIEVTWEAFDNEGIDSFILFVNDFPLEEYSSDIRSATISLPVPENERVGIQLKILATDISGNTNFSMINFTYDKDGYLTINPEIQRRNQLIEIGQWSLIVVFLVMSTYLGNSTWRSLRSDRSKSFSLKKLTSNLPKNELFQAFGEHTSDPQVITTIKQQSELTETEIRNNESIIQIETKIDTLRQNLRNLAYEINTDQNSINQLTRLIDIILNNWLDQVKEAY